MTNDMTTLYTNKKEKIFLIREIIDNNIDINTNIYVINLSEKYGEPYIENLADINIGTIQFLIEEEDIIFALKENSKE